MKVIGETDFLKSHVTNPDGLPPSFLRELTKLGLIWETKRTPGVNPWSYRFSREVINATVEVPEGFVWKVFDLGCL